MKNIIIIVLLATLVPVGTCVTCGLVTCGSCAVLTSDVTKSVKSVSSEAWEKVQSEERAKKLNADIDSANAAESEEVLERVQFETNCNVREAPNSFGVKLGVAKPFTAYEVVKREGKWVKIRFGNIRGWCGCEIFTQRNMNEKEGD